MLVVGCWFGCWMLDVGFWLLDVDDVEVWRL